MYFREIIGTAVPSAQGKGGQRDSTQNSLLSPVQQSIAGRSGKDTVLKKGQMEILPLLVLKLYPHNHVHHYLYTPKDQNPQDFLPCGLQTWILKNSLFYWFKKQVPWTRTRRETGVERNEVTCPRSHRKRTAEYKCPHLMALLYAQGHPSPRRALHHHVTPKSKGAAGVGLSPLSTL